MGALYTMQLAEQLGHFVASFESALPQSWHSENANTFYKGWLSKGCSEHGRRGNSHKKGKGRSVRNLASFGCKTQRTTL